MASIDVLFEAPDVQMGEFRCLPGDPRWNEENSIGSGWHVVFPGTSALITQAGGRPIVANPNHAVLYDEWQTYRRELLSDEGDRCVFVVATANLIRAVHRDLGDRARGESERPQFVTSNGPIDTPSFLMHRRLVSYLRAGGREPTRVREALYGLLRRTIGAAVGERSRNVCPRRRRATLEQHDLLVDEAKRILSTRFAEQVLLDDLAAALFVSPYHLARLFRARAGWSIHEYMTDLRLRSSLERLPGTRDIATLATDCGFSSHGHFTGAFRRRFGAPPSAVRRTATPREISELRTMMEALPRQPA